MNGKRPRVFVIVLNWNGIQDTIECLESLKKVKYDNMQIIVVDNGSTQDEANIIRNNYGDWISVIRTEKNLGYAGGNNVGIRFAMERFPDYILLLNNDTVVAPDFLEKLIFVAESDPRIGIVGPIIYFYPPNNTKEIIWSAGGRLLLTLGQPFHIGLNTVDRGQYNAPMCVDYVSGCALLIKKEVINCVGLLEEEYFTYFEDLEWNIRARKTGFKCMIVPNARIWHKASKTSGYRTPLYMYFHIRNRIRFVRRNTNSISFALLFIPFLLLLRMPYYALVLRRKDKLKDNLSLVLGLKDGLSNRNIDMSIINSMISK